MMDLYEAAQATGGTASAEGHFFTGVSTDSRSIATGELFVALKGDRFDGHDYVRDVLARGAAAAVVEHGWAAQHGEGLPLVHVADTRLALGSLGGHWRRQFDLPLIGVTGSNGKTTVKEMCAAILREHERRDDLDPAEVVLATAGNLNNDIGLPLMLLRLSAGHRAAVIEMGMNHPGEIAYLTRLARPSVAVINNAQRAHLSGLGSLADVARAKGEIFEGLSDDGIAVINADDPHADLWRQLATGKSIVSFGMDAAADVRATARTRGFVSEIALTALQGSVEFDLLVPGRHNVMNALAAAAACLSVGANLGSVAEALSRFGGIKGRLQRRAGRNGALLIDDTYNANPDSMRAAIDVLASLPGRRIFVMGDMAETGEAAGQLHDEIGGYAKSRGIDRLFALGELSVAAAHNFGGGAVHCRTPEELSAALKAELGPDVAVLVKGSRFMRMERVVDAVTEKQHAA
ncbi:MAG: UDP-N-acetylmuramoyl-tripeptide--D-alanyl-D-alanine ligase [Gammaproteobacteria bacterium]|nr:UDP-N-acetylmuramoyl-tripeptide--D-alanyl-D-alanine ligase [Gammaproteobacteria bacterium]MBU1415665.1 UDP-N-acetylmuramoyl-tripeptide--D-alanyl-D-alanine ligase [Gammaproteobacteria bacterium]